MLTLTLKVDPTANPVTGTVLEEGGRARDFTGWTQLGHVLDMAIVEAGRRAATAHERATSRARGGAS